MVILMGTGQQSRLVFLPLHLFQFSFFPCSGRERSEINSLTETRFYGPFSHFGDIVPSQSLSIVLKKLNVTKQGTDM